MLRRVTITASLLLAAACAPGCLSEAVGKVKGPDGVYGETKPVADFKDHLTLARYNRFELGPITDAFAGKVPPTFFSDLQVEFRRRLSEADLPESATGKTLVIRGQVIFYESAGTLGLVLGDIEQVVARLELVDKESGRVLGQAICIGRTTTRLNQGIGYKAEGMAKAIVDWIQGYCPRR